MTFQKIKQSDREPIFLILEQSSVFTTEEIRVALELIDIVLHDPHQKDYIINSCISGNGEVIGFYCIGPTPLTNGTYDLYWIAVKPSFQKKGIGKMLIHHAEELVKSQSGRLLIAETSSQSKYESTRIFYIGVMYQELARIKDYYKIGDDLVIYGKYVSQLGESQ